MEQLAWFIKKSPSNFQTESSIAIVIAEMMLTLSVNGPLVQSISCIVLMCLQPEMKDSVSQFMSGVHQSVNRMSISYLQNERRYNYTTPKSFLEQIKLYQNLLGRKHQELLASMNRLENGLEKLKSTAQQVSNTTIVKQLKVHLHYSESESDIVPDGFIENPI